MGAHYQWHHMEEMSPKTIKEILNYALPYSAKKYRERVLAQVQAYGFQKVVEEIQPYTPHLKEEKIRDILTDYLML